MDYETLKRREAIVKDIDEAKENIEELPISKRSIEEYLLCPEHLRHTLPHDFLGYVLGNYPNELRYKIVGVINQVIDLYIVELEAKVEQKKRELETI